MSESDQFREYAEAPLLWATQSNTENEKQHRVLTAIKSSALPKRAIYSDFRYTCDDFRLRGR